MADGTALAAEKLARVLTNDPAMGVLRHVDAGYEEARQVATATSVRIPMDAQPHEHLRVGHTWAMASPGWLRWAPVGPPRPT